VKATGRSWRGIDLPMTMPSPDEVRPFRVTPTVIAVLDDSKGVSAEEKSGGVPRTP